MRPHRGSDARSPRSSAPVILMLAVIVILLAALTFVTTIVAVREPQLAGASDAAAQTPSHPNADPRGSADAKPTERSATGSRPAASGPRATPTTSGAPTTRSSHAPTTRVARDHSPASAPTTPAAKTPAKRPPTPRVTPTPARSTAPTASPRPTPRPTAGPLALGKTTVSYKNSSYTIVVPVQATRGWIVTASLDNTPLAARQVPAGGRLDLVITIKNKPGVSSRMVRFGYVGVRPGQADLLASVGFLISDDRA